MADEIDTRQAIAAAKEAFNTFSQSGKEYRMDCLQRLHDAVAKRMDQLVDATVLEYGAPQDRAKGSNNLAANIFLHFKNVLKDFDLARTVGTSKVVMEPSRLCVRYSRGRRLAQVLNFLPPELVSRRYSVRKAVIGSTRPARRAGR
jgi:acyl-CoA reductase-like NAD-dependent aldehyde dehydrogenase